MATRIHPRNGLVLIHFIEDRETKTASGIIIPPTAGMNFVKARIIEVGRGIQLDGPGFEEHEGGQHSSVVMYAGTDDLKPGMLVLVKKEIREDLRVVARVTIEINEDGQEVHLINQQDIFAVLDEEPTPITNEEHAAATDSGTGRAPDAHDENDDLN